MPEYIYNQRLESLRLITRHLTLEDINIWSEYFKDKEAIRYIPDFGFNSDFDKAQHMIEKQLARYKEKRFGLQVLLNKKTKEFIGLCGLLTQEVDGQKEIEVGYHLFKKYWGQGYATEAAKLFIDYAFKNKVSTSVISVIDTGNIKSQRVAEKNGLTIEKQTKLLDLESVYIYRIKDNGI